MKLDKPKKRFFTPDEINVLANKATERTKLFVMLALNCGFGQMDISTLEASMIDWETGVITRDRHKTGVQSKSKLWPSTLALLKKHRSPKKTGLVLLDKDGKPLLTEKINANGNLSRNDAIHRAFARLLIAAKITDKRHFKHLRKSGANEIEKLNPDLTSLYLAHGETKTKRHYVEQHFEKLFVEVAKLENLFGFA